MANFDIDYRNLVVHVAPDAAIAESDFSDLEHAIDPLVAQHGAINGLVLEISAFPGWESLPALRRHLRFVREHHSRVRRVAVVSDDALAKLLEALVAHFVAAEVRRFDAAALDQARHWAAQGAHDVVT
ncbi:MAG: STAS/SEC14 domain-containing protein [Gammaproteobacteria bacterium]|uniref:STAS/SEC14 domain-containing protein n=1 Tax=Oceanibaculum nanhaiense TaxID=1909734 RepID=UPI0032EEF27E